MLESHRLPVAAWPFASWLVISAQVAIAQQPPPPAPTQPPPPAPAIRPTQPQGIQWQRTLADAMAVQQATGLPLLVAVNTDGEVFNERFAGDVYHDADFIRSTQGYVCVLASPDRHSERDYDALGNRIECPRFGGCTCSEHINIEPELFRRYFKGSRNAPRHVGVDKDQNILFDRFLDQSMQTAIDAIATNRGTPPAALSATDDLDELFRRRDAMARTLLERRYRAADKQGRQRLLEAAAMAKNDPLDLLRIGIREVDGKLCGLAALALSKVGGPDALIDIEDALARIDDAAIKGALIEQLKKIGETSDEAARMASNFESSENEVPLPWRNDWAEPAFGAERESIEAEMDRVEAALKKQPESQKLRLQLATVQAAFACMLIGQGGDGVELWLVDAQRNADRVKDQALQTDAKAIRAITDWYRGETATAQQTAIEAMSVAKSSRRPDPWLAATFLDVVLQVTAQTAYGRTEQDPKASLRAELGRVRGIMQLLEARDRGAERGELAAIGLLEFAGLRAEAEAHLHALVRRYPGSIAVHDRWRNRLLVDLGAELMRHRYAKFVTDSQGRATAQWFAGYAALVAAERHTQDDRRIEAENAYGDAIERLLDSAAKNEDYADSANHYAVLALAGRAAIRQLRGNGRGAVADLLQAADLRPASLDLDDGLQRKPRAIASRVQRELRAAGQTELADQLAVIAP